MKENAVECVIQCDKKDSGVFYYIVPSPSLGLTAKCGALIKNDLSSPIWNEITQYSFESGAKPMVRLVAELEQPFEAYEPALVVSLTVIEQR